MDNTSATTSSFGDDIDATCYDVFLSFRGEDTRDSFTDHLYEALGRAGLFTFRDNDEIDRGRELKPEIERAIKASKASIVVLSEHYATSAWCLEELWLILEQRREFGHFVLPVFYRVDPSDVRKQDKSFKIEVKVTSSMWTDENVKRWRGALTKVANLTGGVLSGLETKFLNEIVDTVYNELDCKKVYLPPDLIGMDTRYEDITSWLHEPNLEFLAICGMGGSGKTTLAKYIYNKNWKRFENTSFVEDIGTRCKGPHGFRELQEQLLKDILGGRKRKIPSVSRGTCKIEEALHTKRTLIVLDDIVKYGDLVSLLGTAKIHAQSKIIITTENTNDLFKFSSRKCEQYKMRLLNDDESLELLSRHAFGSKVPTEGFKELASQAVRYCDGNPLGLGALGSSLSGSNTVVQWKSQLNLLEKDIHSEIQGVLMRSYMSLPFDFERELFLHIACFFIGKDADYVAKILEPDYFAVSGIRTLINRCLLSVSSSNELMMHRLLQETGRYIVCKEAIKLPEKRSRVWLSVDSYKILRKGKGSKTIEGLTLDMEKLKEEGVVSKALNLKTDALEKMEKLKLLQLNFVELNGSHENFSEDLRWLCWFGFHLGTIPSGLFMGNLVSLDMSYSKLEVFEPPMMLYEFDIMSTSLPNIKDSKTTPEYISESSSLSFNVPLSPKNQTLKGLNVTFKYTISGGDDWVWFAKISTDNGVDLMYNPKVFGKPGFGEVGIWLGYWPIGNALDVGDKVNVSVDVMSGLEVHECGASLVYYTDDEIAEETAENNTGGGNFLGGDFSGFQLITGAYYLCRRDFVELKEVGRLAPDWFRVLAGDTVDYREVRGWRMTGRPKQLNPSFTELKIVRCIIHGPQSEEVYKIGEMSESSSVNEIVEFTSSILGETTKSGTTSETSDATAKEKSEGYNVETMGMSKAFVSDETVESASTPDNVKSKSTVTYVDTNKFVLELSFTSDTEKHKAMKEVGALVGVTSVALDPEERNLTVIGEVMLAEVLTCLDPYAEIIYVSVSIGSKKEVVVAKEPSEEYTTNIAAAEALLKAHTTRGVVVVAEKPPKELKKSQEPFQI